MRGRDKEMSVENRTEQESTGAAVWTESVLARGAWAEWFDKWIRGEFSAGCEGGAERQSGRKETQAWQQQ